MRLRATAVSGDGEFAPVAEFNGFGKSKNLF
jgi:hypothetical protein